MGTSDEPDVRRHKRGWIVLACLVAVVCAFLLLFLGWYRGYRDWHNSKAAPLFADIQPADGGTVYATDAWIRWTSPTESKGRVLWHKVGSSNTRSVDAGSGLDLLAQLGSLSAGSRYEYIVEETDGTQTLRSSVRTLNVISGLSFDPVIDQTVDRDYDQTVKLTLHNRGSQSVQVAARALKQYEDLPSDITGFGSVEVPATIAANSTLDLRLAVTAADAISDTYDIPIEAAGAYVIAKFHVRRPKLNLAFRVLSEDPKTLAKMVEIQNNGDTLSDLIVGPAHENEADITLEPSINHLKIYEHEGIRFAVTPVLYLEFESLHTQIEARAAGQTAKFPMDFKAPPGMHLIAFRSESSARTKVKGHYCTNDPNTCSMAPGLPGNGPSTVQAGAPALAKRTRSPDRNDLAFNFSENSGDTFKRQTSPTYLAENSPRLLLAAVQNVPVYPPQPVPAPTPSREPCYKTSNGDQAPTAAACTRSQKCIECFSKARELMEEYQFANNQFLYWKSQQVQRDEGVWGNDPTVIDNNVDRFHARMLGLQDTYNALRSNCLKNCKIPLPDNISDAEPLPSAGDIARKATTAERIDDLGLPLEFDTLRGTLRWEDLTCEEQDYKAAAGADELFLKHHKFGIGALDAGGSVLILGGLEFPPLVVIVGGAAIGAFTIDGAIDILDDMKRDPPSNDFETVATPTIPPLSIQPGTTEMSRIAFEEIIASHWELAYLRAWLKSYERYQGALLIGNREAAIRQSKALIIFATSGAEASRKAAALKDELRRNLLQELQPQIRSGIHWDDMLDRYRRDESQFRAAMGAAGIQQQTITRVVEVLSSLTPEHAQILFNSWVKEVKRSADWHGANDVYPEILETTFARLQQRSQDFLDYASSAISPSPGPPIGNAVRASIPIGLSAALSREASFMRSHRGALATAARSEIAESTDFAAWYGSKKIHFAWIQNNIEVVAATFDQSGKFLSEPQVMGTGRQPRVTAKGDHVAVAWVAADGNNVNVRLNDGKQWTRTIAFPGHEAALDFGPDGTLYAVASSGLWQMRVDQFELIKKSAYYEPAIAVGKDGKPHVSWSQNGHIFYDGVDIGAGEHPSLVVTSDGNIHVAYTNNRMLIIRTLKDGQWSAPDTIPANKFFWPTLAADDKGNVRLSYIAPAEYGPDATYLVRLPDKQPIMLPSLAGNVIAAWLTTTFNLNQARNYFRPHDLLLTVNDEWIKFFRSTVPEGRYLLRLKTNQVFTSPGKPIPNSIAIHSWHMNPGHYSSNTGYELSVRLAWSEHYVFAANEDDARRSLTSEQVNHDQPDLGLFANAADLPIEMPKPGRINIPILIANLGEASSTPTKLVMYRGEGTTQTLASVAVPALKRGEEKTLPLPLDYDGKMPSINFRLENNKDFDPTNDTLNLVLWEPLPTGYVGPDPTFPKVPVELKVTVDGQPAARYEILDAFTNRVIAKVVNGEQFGALRTGNYHLAVKPYGGEGQETSFTDDVEHQAGAVQQLDLKSGIKIEPQDLASTMSRWSATRIDNPGTTVQWQSGSHSFMALAPAVYQIEFQPSGGAFGSVLWPQKIQVQPGQQAILNINSGLRLDIPQQLVTNLSHWRVVHAGNPAQVVQELDAKNRTIILPPGDYQVSTAGVGSEYQWVTWPQKVQVQPGQQATFTINSGMRLDVPQKLQPDLAHWRVVNLGKPAQGVELDAKNRTIILPPGDYLVSTAGVGSEYQWVTWPQKVQVQPGQQATFTINSGMRLEMPQQIASKLSRWRVLRFGNEQSMVELDANHQTTVLPPGDYQISTAGVGNEYNYLVWPQKIQVQFGKDISVKLDCGIRLTGPGSDRGYRFLLKDDTGRNLEEWGSEMLQLVPPGKYSVEGYSKSSADWKTIQNNVVVKPASVTEITVPVLQ